VTRGLNGSGRDATEDTVARILVVDDDAGIRTLVSDYLIDHGYEVDVAADARAMATISDQRPPDLIVLDVMLPGEDGLAICKRIAKAGGPSIIMLSAMGEEADRVVGLELGADDYLAKPCNPRELLARVRAVLRRRGEHRDAPDTLGSACEFEGWRLNFTRHELWSPDGVAVHLTTGEYQLLRALVEHPRRVLSRFQLLEYARGPESDAFDRAMDVQISRLRKKLQDGRADGAHGDDLIRTVRNEGYIFNAKVTRVA
jgi:two-component system OmpR family response regulator